MGADAKHKSLTSRIRALSPRRLSVLTGGFIAALAILLATKMQEEATARRVETELRVAQAAEGCADGLNLALINGTPSRRVLSECHGGGASEVFILETNGTILERFSGGQPLPLSAIHFQHLPLIETGFQKIEGERGHHRVEWRRLDNGNVALAAAPAADFYQRTPIWFAYTLILGSMSLVLASLMGAFLRQSRAATEAAGAISTLHRAYEALHAGRCSPWYFDGRNRSVVMNRSFLEPLGFGARDRSFTLRELSALIHPEDLRAAMTVFTGTEASGAPAEGAIRLRRPDGSWSRIYLRTSESANRFHRCGVAFDLNGSRSLGAADAIAETRLKDAIESISEAFVLWDARGTLAAWNRRFAAIFNIPQEDIRPGLGIDELTQLARAEAEFLPRYFGPVAATSDDAVEIALSDERWLHLSRRKTAEGGLVCVATNVTEIKLRARAQKKKERILRNAITELQASRSELSETMEKYQREKHRAEDANRAKSEFLANMSHELRTPLNAINGFSQIMQSELYGPLGDEKYKEYISDILDSGRHLLALIDDILDMSKIEAGRIDLDADYVDLEKILEESSRLIAKRAADNGITLTLSIEDVPQVWGDARAVKQVALNLLSNAIKFTPAGGEVSLVAEADLDSVSVMVVDNGCGIDRRDLSRLGAPFELLEGHAAKSQGGSGLGLALSRSLMELQGGVLAIASQRDKGTVACASFPRRAGAKAFIPDYLRDDAQIISGKRNDLPAPAQQTAITSEAAE